MTSTQTAQLWQAHQMQKWKTAKQKLHLYEEEEKKKQKQTGGPSSFPNDEQEQTDELSSSVAASPKSEQGEPSASAVPNGEHKQTDEPSSSAACPEPSSPAAAPVVIPWLMPEQAEEASSSATPIDSQEPMWLWQKDLAVWTIDFNGLRKSAVKGWKKKFNKIE